jgi:mortality factor 4-like protein 1
LQEDEFMRRPAVKIFIPDALKSILVDDWEKVTKENKVAPTPATISVTQFLNEYEEAELVHRRPGSADADILEEVIAGVKEYFNKALGRILLYRFERNQYFDWHKQLEKGHGEYAGKTLCDIYGCEHLLRLFGKIVLLPGFFVRLTDSSCSINARSGRAHQHGCPGCQQAP